MAPCARGLCLVLLLAAASATAAANDLPASAGASAAADGADGAAVGPARRMAIQEGGVGLSAGTKAAYVILSVVLIALSGLMAGLVLGLLSLDRMDLEVMRRAGTDKQRWLVERVEPFSRNPHFVMCSLVLVNAACNTTLPLFIDRLLNPVAAILISVTAVLLFAEIAPQAVCKRYSLEIGAYCAWLVRALMFLTAPVSWPLGKLLDWLLGEESALFRRQELKALVGLHAEIQHDGSVGALTSDEAQVIQGALDLATKTAQAAMTPLSMVFMLSSEAVIDKALLERVIAAGHSRVPVHEGENRQAILGLVLVKELVLVDETAGVKVKQLRLRDIPFLRSDVPLYDVLKIFRFGRRHMACLTRVSSDPSASGRLVGGAAPAANGALNGSVFRRPSTPALASFGDKQVEEVVGIITIEDVLEELLQAEIVDETDQFEDNLQTVRSHQVSLKELPPHLRRFLSPRRSLQHAELALLVPSPGVATPPAAPVRSGASSRLGMSATEAAGGATNGVGQGAGAGPGHVPAQAATATPGLAADPFQQSPVGVLRLSASSRASSSASGSLGSAAHGPPSAPTSPVRHTPSPSLGAAAAAAALVAAGGRGTADGSQATLAAALAAGVRAAELASGGGGISGRNSGLGEAPASAAAASPPRKSSQQLWSGTPEGGWGQHPASPTGPAGDGQRVHVAIELGDVHSRATSEQEAEEAGQRSLPAAAERLQQRRPLVRPGSRSS